MAHSAKHVMLFSNFNWDFPTETFFGFQDLIHVDSRLEIHHLQEKCAHVGRWQLHLYASNNHSFFL